MHVSIVLYQYIVFVFLTAPQDIVVSVYAANFNFIDFSVENRQYFFHFLPCQPVKCLVNQIAAVLKCLKIIFFRARDKVGDAVKRVFVVKFADDGRAEFVIDVVFKKVFYAAFYFCGVVIFLCRRTCRNFQGCF